MTIPTSTAIATEIATSTKTPFPSATVTSTPEPSPTPYIGPNILLYIQDDNQLFSVNADGSNHHEIAQGLEFSISPDKKKIVYRTAQTLASDQDEMVVLDVEQEKVVFRWQIPAFCKGYFMSSLFTWSPDSQRIAFILDSYDLIDHPAPDCKLENTYKDMGGLYQIDLTSIKITRPPIDANLYFYTLPAYMSLLYSPDSLKLRIGTRGQAFDAETWQPVNSEPFYDLLHLGSQAEKIGTCDGFNFNLCLYDQNDQISKHLTRYEKTWEGIETFKVFPNGSAVVYETQEHQLHLFSLSSDSDEIIGTDVWEYFVTSDNRKIVFYQRDKYGKEANIFVVNNDGANNHSISEFPARSAAISGPLMALSPTGDKAAFVNSNGIAIIDLDGNNLLQLVKLPDGVPTDRISLEILDWY